MGRLCEEKDQAFFGRNAVDATRLNRWQDSSWAVVHLQLPKNSQRPLMGKYLC